jgi:glyoxylase I family protein
VTAAASVVDRSNVRPVTTHEGSPGAAPMTGLSHVQLLVSDLSASAAWYTATFGLEPYVEDRDNGYIALRHRAAKIVIVLTSASHGASVDGLPTGRLDHIAFAVADEDALRKWAGHLTSIGIAHEGVVLEQGKPSLQLRDPDGIAIELVAPSSLTR